MTAYEEKQADLAEIIGEEGIEIGWNPLQKVPMTSPAAFRPTESFRAIQSDMATRFTFVSGGSVRGSDFYLVADRRDFPNFNNQVPKSGFLFEVPLDSGKLFRVGEIQTSETDPALEMVMVAKDSV